MPHDIIDNREVKLIDELARRFPSSEKAKFAVGYFFLSGLEPLCEQFYNLQELWLLIGNTTNKETIEQISEGYRRLEPVQETIEAQAYPKRAELKARMDATVENVREAIELMEQTDTGQELVATLVQLIVEKRLKVRVYNRGRLHAKAYIFDYGQSYDAAGRPLPRIEPGVAIIGSSNFTLSGISHNTELNVIVHGKDNHERLTQWFEELWNEAEEFDLALMEELKQSWALAQPTPYDIYMKTLYALVRDRLEDVESDTFLWSDDITARLAEFQRVAVRQAIQTINKYNGCFVSDVVGLGKSYIGAAIIKHFERTERARPLIICPKPLVKMWERYNEAYQLNAHVLSMSLLRIGEDGGNLLLNDVRYKDRDFVLVDESHNFRNPDSQRYQILQQYLEGRRCVFLTATPRTRNAWDIYHQLRLFHAGDTTLLPVDPPNLRQYFIRVEQGERSLPELLSNILIRRTRSHILRWYGYDAETNERIDSENIAAYRSNQRQAYVEVGGRKQTFPRRELQTVEYSIEETYNGLYDRLRTSLGRSRDTVVTNYDDEHTLRYARYGLWNYVVKSKQKQAPYSELQRAGVNLRGLMRTMLFKRFESSVYAFRETLGRMLKTHRAFLAALDHGIVPAGEDALAVLHEADEYEESELVAALQRTQHSYSGSDFNLQALREDITHDIAVLEEMVGLVAPITAKQDAKLRCLIEELSKRRANQKILIFTQYADTAQYLFEQLNPDEQDPTIDVIYSNDRDKARIVARFSPNSNPEIQLRSIDTPINTLIATDVLSEGLNLQDCDTVINYDLHWNPVRLIQRFGRIDRIGSTYTTIYGINFLPERALEQNLGLHEILRRRIREIHETIGEDAAVLEPGERLNERAMYAIYTGDHVEELEEDDDGMVGLNEAEELLRQLREDDPAEYERIMQLRDGIRSGRSSSAKERVILCQAGHYQQLMLVDDEGNCVSRDVPTILKLLRCGKDEPTVSIDRKHNRLVSQAKASFAREAWQRRVEQQHTVSLTAAQHFVQRELRTIFSQTDDNDLQAQINVLEAAFRQPLTKALRTELNAIKRAELRGQALIQELSHLYQRYTLDQQRRQDRQTDEEAAPRIVCSEMLA
jgi:superfamily II DNA or RNA helicase